VKPVKHIDSSTDYVSKTGWRILGELELPIGAEADGLVSAWLAEILNPLGLHTDFLNKVLKSARDAAVRAVMVESAESAFEHVHLLVFIPKKKASELNMGQTWGFFRIEKMEISRENGDPSDHSIEFYLYLEG
jgi:hypothetical protein